MFIQYINLITAYNYEILFKINISKNYQKNECRPTESMLVIFKIFCLEKCVQDRYFCFEWSCFN